MKSIVISIMKFSSLVFCLLFSLSSCANESSKPANGKTKHTSQHSESEQSKDSEFVEVTMLKFKFIPETIVIKKGQTIRWVNKEKRQYHSVWFKKYGEKESDYIFPEEFFEKKFEEKGSFDYLCGPHPEMIGKVIVE